MRNVYYKGENILVRWAAYDKDRAPLAFSGLNDLIVVVRDQQGNSKSFSKLGGTITSVSGGLPNEFQFELTVADTMAFGAGKLIGRFTYKVPSGDHSSNELVDIIEEGVESDFIVLQD